MSEKKFEVREDSGIVVMLHDQAGAIATVKRDGSPGPCAPHCTRAEYEEAVRLHDEWAKEQRWRLKPGEIWVLRGDGTFIVKFEHIGITVEPGRVLRPGLDPVIHAPELLRVAELLKLVRERNAFERGEQT